MMVRNALAGLQCVVYVVFIVINYSASGIEGFTRFTNAQVADTHPVYGLPVGWAFAVWGIIFLGVGVHTVYQAVPFAYGGGLEDPQVAKVRVPMLALLSFSMSWIFLFGWGRYWVALGAIVLYAVLLHTVLSRLDLHYFEQSTTPLKTKLCIGVPCSIHAGWVTVASVLQMKINLHEEGWLPSADMAIGLLALATGIAAATKYCNTKRSHENTRAECEDAGVCFLPVVAKTTGAWALEFLTVWNQLAKATA